MIVPKLVFQLHDDDDDTIKEVEPDKDHVHDHANFFKNSHVIEKQDEIDEDETNRRQSLVRQDEEDYNDDHCTLSSPWSTSNQCQDDGDEEEAPRRSSVGDFRDDRRGSGDGARSSFLGRNVDDDGDDAGSRICSISDLYGVGGEEEDAAPAGIRHENKENVDEYDGICSISDLQGLDKKQQGGLDDNEDVFAIPGRDPVSDYSPARGRREGVDMSTILPSIADLQALDGGTEKELPRKQTELDFKQPLDAAVTLQSPEEEESVDGIWFRTDNQVCFFFNLFL